MSKLKKISNNELSEAIGMTYDLIRTIEREYLHANETMPKSILAGIKKYQQKLFAEHDRREDLY